MRIGLDAMGGDHAPAEVVKGALEAVRGDPDLEVVLVGDRAGIRSEIERTGDSPDRLFVEHAPDVVRCDENPLVALRHKQKTSIGRLAEMARAGDIAAMISAGNTGAAVAAAIFSLKILEGVRRAGIATFLPTIAGRSAVIDVGANIRCRPEHLFQYGVMAAIHSRYLLDKENPTIAILNIGSEEEKGNTLVKETRRLFMDSGANFIGNLEGQEVFMGKADVVVCEGFVGNAVLKVAEGLAEAIGLMLGKEYPEAAGLNDHDRGVVYKSLQWLGSRTDYQEYGGAPLLGVRGVCIISHGRSRSRAIVNAISNAKRNVELRMTERIAEELNRLSPASL